MRWSPHNSYKHRYLQLKEVGSDFIRNWQICQCYFNIPLTVLRNNINNNLLQLFTDRTKGLAKSRHGVVHMFEVGCSYCTSKVWNFLSAAYCSSVFVHTASWHFLNMKGSMPPPPAVVPAVGGGGRKNENFLLVSTFLSPRIVILCLSTRSSRLALAHQKRQKLSQRTHASVALPRDHRTDCR